MKEKTENSKSELPVFPPQRDFARALTRFRPLGYRGFSLVEMIMAIFVFSLVMVTMSSIYGRFFYAQKRAKLVQQNTEDAKFVMESMAKVLRTSKLISCNGVANCPATTNQVEAYDYSQDRCIIYYFNSTTKKIESGGRSPGVSKDPTSCVFTGLATSSIINKFVSNMKFSVVQPVQNSVAGKVTILAEVCSDLNCTAVNKDKAILQTSVSLRN